MRLLVTGATGLIGGAVLRAAAARGIETIGCSRRAPADPPAAAAWVMADLADAVAAAEIVRAVAPSHVVHTAWETRHPTYWNDAANLDWVVATTAMARAFAACGGKRFIQIGSCAEYSWTDDSRRDRPATRYGKAKLAAFRAIEAAAQDNFAAVEARIFWVYGPGENAARFIPLLCRSYAEGIVPDLGSGGQRRDLVHVDDAALALLALLDDRAADGLVDIGTGEGAMLADVANLLAVHAGMKETGLGRRPDRPDDPATLLADATALHAAGWRPQLSLREGLERTYAYWRSMEEEAA